MRPWKEGVCAVHAAQAIKPQWGHGLEAVERGRSCPTRTRTSTRRNGATALRPWKAVLPCRDLRRDRTGRNGATALRPWKACGGLPHGGADSCRNGATALRPWKGGGTSSATSLTCSPQWGHGLEAVERCHLTAGPLMVSSRNGATALRPWKARSPGDPPTREGPQWGHGLEAVESRRGLAGRKAHSAAAMEPRP